MMLLWSLRLRSSRAHRWQRHRRSGALIASKIFPVLTSQRSAGSWNTMRSSPAVEKLELRSSNGSSRAGLAASCRLVKKESIVPQLPKLPQRRGQRVAIRLRKVVQRRSDVKTMKLLMMAPRTITRSETADSYPSPLSRCGREWIVHIITGCTCCQFKPAEAVRPRLKVQHLMCWEARAMCTLFPLDPQSSLALARISASIRQECANTSSLSC
mmetsp:Transcript_20072/g.46768  ORF Transcript_20072/g.46768 Transcript_20072/m.46768 type:complete len:213 (-) Transcript_20072:1041-1679(-)